MGLKSSESCQFVVKNTFIDHVKPKSDNALKEPDTLLRTASAPAKLAVDDAADQEFGPAVDLITPAVGGDLMDSGIECGDAPRDPEPLVRMSTYDPLEHGDGRLWEVPCGSSANWGAPSDLRMAVIPSQLPVGARQVENQWSILQQAPVDPSCILSQAMQAQAMLPSPSPFAFVHCSSAAYAGTTEMAKIEHVDQVREQQIETDTLPLQVAPQPHTLEIAVSQDSVITGVIWTVDAKKLKSNDRVAVSPPFSLYGAPFRMMLHPKISSESKGGASFRKSMGRGFLQLKCESKVQELAGARFTFNFVVGSSKKRLEAARGPITHDFTTGGIVGLRKGQDEWNFSQCVDKCSDTFVVCLEILQ